MTILLLAGVFGGIFGIVRFVQSGGNLGDQEPTPASAATQLPTHTPRRLVGSVESSTIAPSEPTPTPASPTPASPTPASPTPASPTPTNPRLTRTTTPSQLSVLCASDAVDPNNNTFSEDAYTSLNRYITSEGDVLHPDLNLIVNKLYAGSKHVVLPCRNRSSIIRTESSGRQMPIKAVKFNIPPELSGQIAKFWVIMTASDTAGIEPSAQRQVGEISGEFMDATNNPSSRPLRKLFLGQDIADWTFRSQPGDSREAYTVAYTSHDMQDVRRVFIGYETQLEAGRLNPRAAQLFAVAVNSGYVQDRLTSITIADTWNEVGLHILAVVLVPEGFPEPAPAPVASDLPLCLKGQGASQNIDVRAFSEDVQRITDIDPIKVGCDEQNPTIIPELAPGVRFFFANIFATRKERDRPESYASTITLNAENSIGATHLYLLMTARNLCLSAPTSQPFIIGHIKIDDKPYALQVGENIREGRTNHTLSDEQSCKGGGAVLRIAPARVAGAPIEGRTGIPVRAEPNNRIGRVEAELWLDLIKIALPDPDRTELTITIENNSLQTNAGTQPFITLYAATLVREAP